jgi:glycosyltransferase involved in cell wall biosynthesis
VRVSILNLNLEQNDAIGDSIINQARFLLRRGDLVRIYTAQPPGQVPEEIAALTSVTTPDDLAQKREEHFHLSDLFIYHYPSCHPLMDSIKGIDRGAVVFYYHNVTPPELWNSSELKDELVRGVEGVSLVHYADLAVADSPFNVRDLEERGYDPNRIHVVPLAVPVQRFVPGAKDPALVHRYGLEGRRVLLFVGRMAGNKRIDLLVEALAHIQKEIPEAALLLVGDTDSCEPYRQVVAEARRLAEKLGVARDVIYTGVVDHLSQLPAYYRLADLYVTASLHEGFGVPLIEAMASGVPVIASRIASHPWVVGEAGELYAPEDAADLARCAVRLLQDDQAYGRCVRSGLERARQFSLEAQEVAFAEVVDEATRWVQALPPLDADEAETAERGGGRRPMRGRRVRVEDLNELYAAGDVMQRPYVVRSRLPLVGPFIAWVRRNMTSHLREPYLDPTLERQVAFNRLVVDALERTRDAGTETVTALQEQLRTLLARQRRFEQRLALLERQVQLATAGEDSMDAAQLEQLKNEIERLRVALWEEED